MSTLYKNTEWDERNPDSIHSRTADLDLLLEKCYYSLASELASADVHQPHVRVRLAAESMKKPMMREHQRLCEWGADFQMTGRAACSRTVFLISGSNGALGLWCFFCAHPKPVDQLVWAAGSEWWCSGDLVGHVP